MNVLPRTAAGTPDRNLSSLERLVAGLRRGRVVLILTFGDIAGNPANASEALTTALNLQDRIEAQRAIEHVYWSHRIAPSDSATAQPGFDEVVTPEVLRAKVEDYLGKSRLLESRWKTPVTARQLQEELDRMTQGSRSPEVLSELFGALGNDPARIAETLVRQRLVDRLVRARWLEEWNASAEDSPAWSSSSSRKPAALVPFRGAAPSALVCADDTWRPTAAGPGAPSARTGHSAVWTGAEMIVWGGFSGAYSAEGGKYDPATDTWSATAVSAGTPSGRSGHTAVWTGTRMIVWGGSDGSNLKTGGRYDPVADSWLPVSTGANSPAARTGHTAVWTGARMIVWGGLGPGPLDTGGQYNPTTDTWTATSTGPNVPLPRSGHTAVWSGTRMLVWGGSGAAGFDLNSGGRYDFVTNTWLPTSTAVGTPWSRTAHTALWTGTRMLVWGGSANGTLVNTGGSYDPDSDAWVPTSAGAGVPSARRNHTAVWTGIEMIVWGGRDATVTESGGRYNPATDVWAATSIGSGVPSARELHTAVANGSQMIVWGGERASADGGVYCASGACPLCDDENSCTDDSCGPNGQCVFESNDANACSDADVCTDDACSGGNCIVTGVLDCDDGDPCTEDACLPSSGCATQPHACNDANPCTTDTCVPFQGCLFSPDDSNSCSLPATTCSRGECENGSCVAAGPLACGDGVECSEDSCVVGTGCVHVPHHELCPDWWDPQCGRYFCRLPLGCRLEYVNSGGPCTDHNACTQRDRCYDVACSGQPIDGCGSDGIACTHDPFTCDPIQGCVYVPDNSLCDDGNPCTADTCSATAGCSHVAPSIADVGPVTADADDATYRWTAVPAAETYDVVRGFVADLPVGPPGVETCLGSSQALPFVVDSTTPAVGDAYWYIVRAKKTCATGSYGWSGDHGVPFSQRISNICP